MSTTTYALITGASKGLGHSIAHEFAKRNIHLLLVARSEDALRALSTEVATKYGIKAHFLSIDMAKPDASKRIKEWVDVLQCEVQYLVNNAGYGLWGAFDGTDLEEQAEMIRLNVQAVVDMTQLFLPQLKKQPAGYILQVASTAAYQAVPTFATYAASKSFVLSFSRALRFELKDTNVSVTCLSPGPINTGFVHRAGLDFMKAKAEKFGMTADEVARIGVKALFHKKTEVVPGLLNKLSVAFIPFLPKKWIERIAANLYKS